MKIRLAESDLNQIVRNTIDFINESFASSNGGYNLDVYGTPRSFDVHEVEDAISQIIVTMIINKEAQPLDYYNVARLNLHFHEYNAPKASTREVTENRLDKPVVVDITFAIEDEDEGYGIGQQLSRVIIKDIDTKYDGDRNHPYAKEVKAQLGYNRIERRINHK